MLAQQPSKLLPISWPGCLLAASPEMPALPCSAQVSIEFLSIAAALIGALALILAGFSGIRYSALAALDVQGAEGFASEVVHGAETLSFLGDGSAQKISAAPVLGWVFLHEGGSCSLAVNMGGEHEKRFNLPANVECGFIGTFRGRGSFTLLRKDSGLLVLDRNP